MLSTVRLTAAHLQCCRRRECWDDVDEVSTGADGLSRTAAERIVMKDSLKSTACFLADVMATAPAAISRSYTDRFQFIYKFRLIYVYDWKNLRDRPCFNLRRCIHL